MVTFFGLGVLALLPMSAETRTTGTGACASSPSELRACATVRVPLVFAIDGRPPCVGHAVLWVATAGLLTPGTSLLQRLAMLNVVVPGQVTRGQTYGGETDVAGVKFVLAPAGDW